MSSRITASVPRLLAEIVEYAAFPFRFLSFEVAFPLSLLGIIMQFSFSSLGSSHKICNKGGSGGNGGGHENIWTSF